MSQENVELARRTIDAFNRRDREIYDEPLTPDFEWLPGTTAALEGEIYRGREGANVVENALTVGWAEFCVIGH